MSFRLKRDESERRSTLNAIHEFDPTMTEQSHKEACDINTIMKRYDQTGIAPGTMFKPEFGDFVGSGDFHSVQNQLIAAQDSFMRLPAKVRTEFDNDPGKFIEAFNDPKNLDKFVSLGLAVKPPKPDATLEDVVQAVKSTKVPKKTAGPKDPG